MVKLTDPIYQDADKAREHLEALQWPNGPTCPHCGNVDQLRITKLQGKSTRPGVYKCKECAKPFTVTVGTVFERSHIPLNKWLLAVHLMAASKKGFSAHQMHRMLGVTYKTAWFMEHRIREAMRDDAPEPIGGKGKIVEADETYFGQRETPVPGPKKDRKPTKGGNHGPANKRAVVALVERGGNARLFHIQHATAANVREVLVRNVPRESTLNTDESRLYTETGKEFSKHDAVKHSAGEYVRYTNMYAFPSGVQYIIHTNTVENVFSVFKRGMKGIYQHCGEAHLHRYLTEFEFRYNRRSAVGVEDTERTEDALRGIVGKRLTYRRIGEAANA